MGNNNPLNSDIIFRRTTLIVRDIKESLNLYQKILEFSDKDSGTLLCHEQ